MSKGSADPPSAEESDLSAMVLRSLCSDIKWERFPSSTPGARARWTRTEQRGVEAVEVEVAQDQKVGVPVLRPVAQARIHVARCVISQPVDHVQGCSLDEIGRVGVLR